MAQGTAPASSPSKRPRELSRSTSEQAQKKLRRSYHHHHEIRHKFKGLPSESESTFLDDAQIDQLLKRAIAAQCRGYGFEQVESTALERFRDVVEEHVLHFASLVRQSMVACRRVQPLYSDFEWAFERTKVPEQYREGELPFEELEHDLQIPFSPNSPPLLPTPPPENNEPPSLDTLGGEHRGQSDRMNGFVPSTFPSLPAPHAYKQTEVYMKRESDARRIRELATEEGRMGEQALRKLAGATRLETKVDLQEEKNKYSTQDRFGWVGPGRKDVPMEAMFERTMQDLMRREMKEHPELKVKGEQVKFELGPIVNWERRYWMQPNVSSRNKNDADSGGSTKGKEVLKVDVMDIS